MVDKSGIVLHYLLNGNKIMYNNQLIRLFKPNEEIRLVHEYGTSDGYWLGVCMMNMTEEVYCGFGLDLVDFLNYCDKISDEELVAMTTSNVMKGIKSATKIL